MQRVYWAERLSLGVALSIVKTQLKHRQSAQVFFFDEPARAGWLRRLLKLASIDAIGTMPIALGDLVNDDGVNLYWHNDELMLSAYEQTVSDLPMRKLAQMSDIPSDILRAFLSRAALADMHQSSSRSTALWGNARQQPGQAHILLLSKSIFTPVLVAAYSCDKIATRVVPHPSWPRLILELLALGRVWLRSWQRSKTSANTTNSCVAIQYTAGFDTDRISDIPWLRASGLQPEQILVNCPAAQLSEAKRSSGNAGFQFADINQEHPGSRPVWYRAALAKALRTTLTILMDDSLGPLDRRIWLARWITAFLRSRTRWECFFHRNAVRLYLHVGDADALALATTDALDRIGGVDIAYQLGGSCIELAMEHRTLTRRLLFAWGSFHQRMYQTIGRRMPEKMPRGIILSGNQYDYLPARHHANASAFRQKLHTRGIKQIIVAFDNVARRDFLISPHDVNEFYDTLLNLAENDPTLAIVVKPKTRECAAFIATTGDRRIPLQAAGRWFELPPEKSTLAAALYGDVTVTLHMGTAAMESAIAGVPHIYYDNTAWTLHPFYRHAKHLIATDPASLQRLLAEHRQGVLSVWHDTEAGRAYRHELSPHQDGRSHERMGIAIGRLFTALRSGTSREASINSIISNS